MWFLPDCTQPEGSLSFYRRRGLIYYIGKQIVIGSFSIVETVSTSIFVLSLASGPRHYTHDDPWVCRGRDTRVEKAGSRTIRTPGLGPLSFRCRFVYDAELGYMQV